MSLRFIESLNNTEMKNRRVRDIFVACVDGLKGFPKRLNRFARIRRFNYALLFSQKVLLFYVLHKDRKVVAADLKSIYQVATLEQADMELSRFAGK